VHSSLLNRRLAPVVGVLAASLVGALAVAPQASAATLYACVNRHTHTARVFSHVPSCRRHEMRVSWSTQGPAGKNGAPGKTGATGKQGVQGKQGEPGKNGAAAVVDGYDSTQSGTLTITAGSGSALGTELPAGHYLVTAKLTTSATAKEVGGAEVECKLLLATATGESRLDSSMWTAPLVSFNGTEYLAASSVSLDAAVNLSAAGTVSVQCETIHVSGKEAVVSVSNGQLVAVQTTNNT
jgi:hypothetical protein